MQASRSLFQTGIKLQGQPASSGISKTRPFLNVWTNQQQGDSKTPTLQPQQIRTMASATTFFDFTPKDKQGQPYPLSQHSNKVVLVVNTASECGFKSQLTGLENLNKALSQKYPDDFAILAFPCNQFRNQEPGSNDDIQSICRSQYGVNFPVLGKTDVNGDRAEEVWEWMKAEKPGLLGLKRVKWNFEKFLIGRDGKVKGRWASMTEPESLEKAIVDEIEKTKGAGAK